MASRWGALRSDQTLSTVGWDPDFALPVTWFKPWLSSETLEIQSQNQRG
jgi:hypothetical protein